MDHERPNVVFVVMDTARAENFSCYGSERITSPFLDSLAEENVKYETAVSQESWTMPSHASIFSGEYVSKHGITGTQSFSDIDSFTDDLSEKGYETFGLTNVAFLTEEFDADQLFDDFTYVQGDEFFSGLDMDKEDFESEKGFRRYVELFSSIVESGNIGKIFSGSRKFLGKKLFLKDSGARKTNRLVREKISNQEDPFFLFLNYVEPHTPYLPPFPYSHKFLDEKLKWGELQDRANVPMNQFMWLDEDPDSEQLEILESLYDGSINYLDSKLEELYNFITEKYPNTVFIFTSDHGEYFYEREKLMEHGKGFHSHVNQVPLIEVFPEDVSSLVSEPIELRCLKDHVLEISNGKFNSIESDGIALSEDIGSRAGEKNVKKDFRAKFGFYGVSVQDEEYKLAWYSSGKKELLKMPEEEIVEDEDKVEELSEIIVDRVGDPEENDYRKESLNPEDEEIKEKLEHLGYM